MQGRLRWDPATLRRAVRDIRAERAKQKQKATARGCSSRNPLGSKPGRKASNSSSRVTECCNSGSEEASHSTDDKASSDGDDDDEDDGRRVCVLDCENFSKTDITEHEFFLG